MKDKILSSYIADFVEHFKLPDSDEAVHFEHFSAHCVISTLCPETFEPDDVVVGGSGDLGLDAIGILVNDHIVRSESDVDHFKTALRRLDVQFIFVQAKTSPHFSAADIGTFLSGVRHFFNDTLPQDANEYVKSAHRLKAYIYEHTFDMDHTPICRLYYITTGTWNNEHALVSRIDQGTNDLKTTDLFSSVHFAPMDADAIKQCYREINQRVLKEIQFEKHTILPMISGVEEAYIGILPCSEYINLISDQHGNLNRRLFYDNVRDFQGHNAVNQEIEATIQHSAQSDRFSLLNNGVTIVARDANKVGVKFRLRDYQIVNGCQTSHVLHRNRSALTDSVFLPVKLIVTTDAEVINQIIKGTNRQTEVKLEAFESLTPYQKELEEYYMAASRDRQSGIYYERRSKQYEHLNLQRDKIITLATQVNCFVAMFLNEPHSTHRYYGELLNSYRNRVFAPSHSHMPYFLSGVALNAIERLFASGTLSRGLRKFKYHILMVFRLMNEPFPLPYLNEQSKMEKYCQALMTIVDDEALCVKAFEDAASIVRAAELSIAETRDPLERTRAFTGTLVAAANKDAIIASSTRLQGVVAKFSDTLGYGFIRDDNEKDYFVHYSQIGGSGFRSLVQGERVEFTPIETKRGPQATSVDKTEYGTS